MTERDRDGIGPEGMGLPEIVALGKLEQLRLRLEGQAAPAHVQLMVNHPAEWRRLKGGIQREREAGEQLGDEQLLVSDEAGQLAGGPDVSQGGVEPAEGLFVVAKEVEDLLARAQEKEAVDLLARVKEKREDLLALAKERQEQAGMAARETREDPLARAKEKELRKQQAGKTPGPVTKVAAAVVQVVREVVHGTRGGPRRDPWSPSDVEGGGVIPKSTADGGGGPKLQEGEGEGSSTVS